MIISGSLLVQLRDGHSGALAVPHAERVLGRASARVVQRVEGRRRAAILLRQEVPSLQAVCGTTAFHHVVVHAGVSGRARTPDFLANLVMTGAGMGKGEREGKREKKTDWIVPVHRYYLPPRNNRGVNEPFAIRSHGERALRRLVGHPRPYARRQEIRIRPGPLGRIPRDVPRLDTVGRRSAIVIHRRAPLRGVRSGSRPEVSHCRYHYVKL